MRRARALRLGAAGLLSVLGSACLVTDKPVFGEPNAPATLVPDAPKTTLTRAPTNPDPVCSSASRYMAFVAKVSDANISDPLIARLLINGDFKYQQPIPTTDVIARDELTFCVTKRDLSASCNHVELIVSNEFQGPARGDVSDPNDFAVVEWWVLAPADVDPMANPDSCLDLIDGGM